VGRPLAAFHLDRLAAAGLLEVEYHRRSGRVGPGAGRPAKFYRRPRRSEIAVSLPPRQYGLAADILAAAVEQSEDAAARVLDEARERGRELAADQRRRAGDTPDLEAALAEGGYEPRIEDDGAITLANCPFDALAQAHRSLTCSLNLAMLDALATDLGEHALVAQAAPRDGRCCVAFVPEGASTS
jgi:predicted ArsR family transcriptional regulator